MSRRYQVEISGGQAPTEEQLERLLQERLPSSALVSVTEHLSSRARSEVEH